MRRPLPKKRKWWHLSRDEAFKIMQMLLTVLGLLLHW